MLAYLLSILFLLTILPRVRPSVSFIYPCSSTEPITWVRDPNNCQKYFICYFGQPITMPNCPANQVWSNAAVNCVPESSSWNDCHPRSTTTDSKNTITTTGSSTQPDRSNISTPTSTIPVVSTTGSILEGQPCFGYKGILPHPTQCHWYYNCSLAADLREWAHYERYTRECPYPQLFDEKLQRCREYFNMYCGTRFEPVDHCEYREEQCQSAHCIACEDRFANCRGKSNGIYPFRSDIWSPIVVSCYDQRNIAQDKCMEPTPIFSPVTSNCVSLFEVPKQHGGLKPDCSFRKDGFYADEQGRCSVYFECQRRLFVDYFECNSNLVFNPVSRNCTYPHIAPPPCGENQSPPSCRDREDGFYADEYGRCPYYFVCKNFTFLGYRQCDAGSFDASKQECIIPAELMMQPCGLLNNPCNKRNNGKYAATPADSSDKCRDYIECSRGVLIYKGTCKNGSVFNKETGQCDQPENVPRPCGKKNRCANKKNGVYPERHKGCSHYYECTGGNFKGFGECNYKKGGIVFNSITGRCDVRKNVCSPCGYKLFGCRCYQIRLSEDICVLRRNAPNIDAFCFSTSFCKT